MGQGCPKFALMLYLPMTAMREKADKLNQEVTMKEAQLEELVKAQEATKADQEEMQSIIASLKMDQE